MKLSREAGRVILADALGLPRATTWGVVWKTSRALGAEIHHNLRAWALEMFDCVPSF